MNTEATASGATGETTSPDQPKDKLTLDKVGGVLDFADKFPWVGLGVLSTCFGVLIMYAYFRGVGPVPVDVATTLGAGVGIGGAAFAYVLAVIVALIVPHGIFAMMDSLNSAPWRSWSGSLKEANNLLIGAQLLGVGLFFGYLSWEPLRNCAPGLQYLLVPAIIFSLSGGAALLHAGSRRSIWSLATTLSFLFLLLEAALPLLVLFELLVPTGTTSLWTYLLWLGLWFVVIFVLGILPKTFPLWGVALAIPFLLPALLWLGPALGGHGDLFPQRVMEMAGIRTAKAVELKVPQATCELIAATARFGPSGQAVRPCGTETPWVTVRAQVLSNLGSRWWVEVQQVGALPVDPAEILRMSIPADGVQLVQRKPANAPESTNRCKAKP